MDQQFTSSIENLDNSHLPNLSKEPNKNNSRNNHRVSNANTESDAIKMIKYQNKPEFNVNSSFDFSTRQAKKKKQLSKFNQNLKTEEKTKILFEINGVLSNKPTRLLFRNSNFTKPLIESERDLS